MRWQQQMHFHHVHDWPRDMRLHLPALHYRCSVMNDWPSSLLEHHLIPSVPGSPDCSIQGVRAQPTTTAVCFKHHKIALRSSACSLCIVLNGAPVTCIQVRAGCTVHPLLPSMHKFSLSSIQCHDLLRQVGPRGLDVKLDI